jgi:hypothetical protein
MGGDMVTNGAPAVALATPQEGSCEKDCHRCHLRARGRFSSRMIWSMVLFGSMSAPSID